jgi:hypothetical protein
MSSEQDLKTRIERLRELLRNVSDERAEHEIRQLLAEAQLELRQVESKAARR